MKKSKLNNMHDLFYLLLYTIFYFCTPLYKQINGPLFYQVYHYLLYHPFCIDVIFTPFRFYFVLLIRSLLWNGFKACVCKIYILANSTKFFTSFFFFSFLENSLGACISLLMFRLIVKDAHCKMIILIIFLSILNFKNFFVLRYKRLVYVILTQIWRKQGISLEFIKIK